MREMLPSEYASQDCSIARALEVVGERWTLLIVREALLGARSFDDFTAGLGVASNTLTRRLDSLVDDGVLVRVTDPTDRRRRIYNLTEKGRRLGVVVEALREWGDRYGPGRPPVSFQHRDCGGNVELAMRCTACAEDLDPLADLMRTQYRPIRRHDAHRSA
jgi:DNA-binding HxlR family transcriptional regulator